MYRTICKILEILYNKVKSIRNTRQVIHMKKVLWLAGLFAALSIEGFAYNVYAPQFF